MISSCFSAIVFCHHHRLLLLFCLFPSSPPPLSLHRHRRRRRRRRNWFVPRRGRGADFPGSDRYATSRWNSDLGSRDASTSLTWKDTFSRRCRRADREPTGKILRLGSRVGGSSSSSCERVLSTLNLRCLCIVWEKRIRDGRSAIFDRRSSRATDPAIYANRSPSTRSPTGYDKSRVTAGRRDSRLLPGSC